MSATSAGWLQALNPPIYLISILPGLAVWQLTRNDAQTVLPLTAATLGVILLQHAINVLNDVSDWRLGADEEKFDSWARFHDLDLVAATRHGWLSLVAGGLVGLAALLIIDRLWIIALALPMVWLGYLYNSGQKPISYTSLGEWVTGLCYGPGVVGCLWLVSGSTLDGVMALTATAFAALAMGLLLSHQPPQVETDRAAGKQSFAVRYGTVRTEKVARLLFSTFVICWCGAVALNAPMTGSVRTITLAVALLGVLAVYRTTPRPKRLLPLATLLVLVPALPATVALAG